MFANNLEKSNISWSHHIQPFRQQAYWTQNELSLLFIYLFFKENQS